MRTFRFRFSHKDAAADLFLLVDGKNSIEAAMEIRGMLTTICGGDSMAAEKWIYQGHEDIATREVNP